MATATKESKTIVKIVEVKETTNIVNLVLTEEEAEVVLKVIGNIQGCGKYRAIADHIYESLYEVVQGSRNDVPHLQRTTAFEGEYTYE